MRSAILRATATAISLLHLVGMAASFATPGGARHSLDSRQGITGTPPNPLKTPSAGIDRYIGRSVYGNSAAYYDGYDYDGGYLSPDEGSYFDDGLGYDYYRGSYWSDHGSMRRMSVGPGPSSYGSSYEGDAYDSGRYERSRGPVYSYTRDWFQDQVSLSLWVFLSVWIRSGIGQCCSPPSPHPHLPYLPPPDLPSF